MPWYRFIALALGAALLHASARSGDAASARPSIVFVLLDTTRADHFGAWGHGGETTPALDRLAGHGIRFARHFANSHATRPSMPQLMTGRYFHDNILAPFQRDAHPREMSFARPDPTAALLPGILRTAGYLTVAVSAHTWVAAESDFGRQFDRFEMLPFSTHDAHGDATPLVDRAIALWRERDPSQPVFLYLHFMDMHIPRRLPEGEPSRPVPGYDWRRRFRSDGQPAFDRERRSWARYDASDFTPDDRAHYAAVYDTRLRHADAEIGRLVAALEGDDPGLAHTLIVVTADHGEELGEDDRIEHPPSLVDAVQHVPWIMAGAGLAAGQRCDGTTEHVDVVPTVLATVGVALPPDVLVDGTGRLGLDGDLREPCGGTEAFYAWDEYRALRFHRWLFVERLPPGGVEAQCDRPAQLYHLDGEHRVRSGQASAERIAYLRRRITERLNGPASRYEADHYATPTVPFVVRADRWEVDHDAIRCVAIGPDTPLAPLTQPGWMWTGRGIALLQAAIDLPIRLRVPAGIYGVEAGINPVSSPPWLFGRARWRRRSFRGDTPSAFVSLGSGGTAPDGTLIVRLPRDALSHQHVLALRLTPPGAGHPRGAGGIDREEQERLRKLGYVQ